MKETADVSQFGNKKGSSIQHYLIKMVHRIHTALDNNSRREIFAVLATFVDWNSALVSNIRSYHYRNTRGFPLTIFVSEKCVSYQLKKKTTLGNPVGRRLSQC